MTIILAAAFTRTAAEHLVAQSSEDQVNALGIAQSGLNAFFHDAFVTRPPSGDSVRYNVVGGFAWVYMDELRKPADTIAEPITYVIRSVGYVIDPNQGSTPMAERSVAQFAEWQTGDMPLLGAMTTANRLDIDSRGISAIYGVSNCVLADTLRTVRASSNNGISGSLDSTNGFPWLISDLSDSVASWTNIDWSTINSGNFTTDYNSVQWGDSTYSSQQVSNNLTINTGFGAGVMGTGLLIVPGRLTINGFAPFRWHGVILVGERGRFRNRNTFIHGSLVTGLDEGLGSSVGDTDIGGRIFGSIYRNFRLYYDPCEVQNTMDQYSGFRRVDGAWVDNWATY